MSWLLIQKIISLYIILLLGVLLTRLKVFQQSFSKTLSIISVYLLLPCMILSSFQIERNSTTQRGLLLALMASVVIHALFLLVNRLLRKPLRLDAVEQTSVIYSNAGNLIMPLVLSILGKEWVVYCSPFLCVQQLLLWTHARSVMCGTKASDLKSLFGNINILAVIAGLILFLTGLRLPKVCEDAVESMASCIGPLSMLITGILVGSMGIRKLTSYRRMWLTAALRLLVLPLLTLGLLYFSGMARLSPDGASVLLVVFMGVASCSASAITSMSLVFHQDAEYASAINLVTTLLCVVTLPLMISLYTRFFQL